MKELRLKQLKSQITGGSSKEIESQAEARVALEFPAYANMTKEEMDQVMAERVLPQFKTWVQLMFEGETVTIIKCQKCERTSSRMETFMDLSIDIEQNISLRYCLKKFSTKELLNLSEKFFCESCLSKQVATRQMMIKKKPRLLLTHLKRFKMNMQTL
eukprot:CAMPEP_0170478664 /NCGR_PEP_ID=MMETSP0208-20121228/151_1 /TAXON_ID=197538 /ORGANISM="Strombidium inclinatum, Strain S3" /LENGTH=157 /DNA_ID=CAMNT_0010750959 /DNA_START=681 /DNA_END=1154 /DNA_ORIENTATION=+